MSISIFDTFSIGIGPSSSHTIGPMRAAQQFATQICSLAHSIARVQVDLYGSLALTGIGHGTDKAILLGLCGELPEQVDPDTVTTKLNSIKAQHSLNLAGKILIPFHLQNNLLFHQKEFLPKHANGMRFRAYDIANNILAEKITYSIGGGFILDDEQFDHFEEERSTPPYAFTSAAELLALCQQHQFTIAQLMWHNELSWHSEERLREGILQLAQVMMQCIDNGCNSQEKTLPGGLRVRRRAPELYNKLRNQATLNRSQDLFNWLNLYALAVNEENAGGGRVVTAPTNGAAGIIPSTLKYYQNFVENSSEQGVIDFLLTAAAIAILYKKGASISAAEVGCQGEVGVACSMAAGALTAVLGGTLEQVEMAAEMGMEHNLGLTCDPIQGLVQIPCIERNAMGAIQAVNCASLALMEEGKHYVNLDAVIATMLRTGRDMQSQYKETALGGLAVNVPEC